LGNKEKSGEKWGFGEREGFTKYPPIPKSVGVENTLEVNKALRNSSSVAG
jgi:hypothetical protein